jgi:3-oxoacyl-[acyl-carrier-protein] synthase III
VSEAGEDCLARWGGRREEVDLVMHTGVYRSEFLSEPAVAAIAAGELRINADEQAAGLQRTFAFDLLNGAAGTLTACCVASQFIAAHRFTRALLLASEVEHNADVWPENIVGLREAGSAILLESGSDGFIAFGTQSFPEHLDCVSSYTVGHDNQPAVSHRRDERLDEIYCGCIVATVQEFLEQQGLTPQDVRHAIYPHRSAEFVQAAARVVGIAAAGVAAGAQDLFTSSLAYSLAALRQQSSLPAGELVLIVEVAAGMQVICALYRVGPHEGGQS